MLPSVMAWMDTSDIHYPNEIIETLMEAALENAEWWCPGGSEVAAINMVYGGAACGKYAMTSSSVQISLKQEGISYLAGAEPPAHRNVQRGRGWAQPAVDPTTPNCQGWGHGDYRLITLALTGSEMADFGVGFRSGVQVPQSGNDSDRRCYWPDDGESEASRLPPTPHRTA